MHRYSISKYNPEFRGMNGSYLKDDWIAVSDIGRRLYDGIELTANEYFKVENNYVKAILLIMKYLKIPYLNVKDACRNFSPESFNKTIKNAKITYFQDILETYNCIEKFEKINEKEVDHFIRLKLREDISADIYYPRRMKIFICYDYLMGVHTSKSIIDIIPAIEALGLFVEEF